MFGSSARRRFSRLSSGDEMHDRLSARLRFLGVNGATGGGRRGAMLLCDRVIETVKGHGPTPRIFAKRPDLVVIGSFGSGGDWAIGWRGC